MVYPKSTPLPDEEPPTPLMSFTDNEDGGDTVPDHGLVGEYSEGVRHQGEHNGGSYRLKHLRSAPEQEIGFTSGQGRLFPASVPYSDQRVGGVPQTFTETPTGEALQYANTMSDGPTSDAHARRMQVQAPPHPVFFDRGRSTASHPQGNQWKQEPDQGAAVNVNGRRVRNAVHRPEQRY